MILIDLTQISLGSLFEQIGASNQQIDTNLFRHMLLNTIRAYVKKFKLSHGPEVVIACDNRNYWRRKVFPFYKSSRKKNRDSSIYDWDSIFDSLNLIRKELKEYSPYKVVDVDGAEADDVIAVLVQEYSKDQKMIILSMDRDFVQLQKYPNVEQYSTTQKKYIKEQLPVLELKRKIIRGDKGDGIPSILSPDNTFVDGIRQRPLTEVKLIDWLSKSPEDFCTEEMLRNYNRNQLLIDFDYIPTDIKQEILNTYKNTAGKTKQVFLNYMIQNNLRHLIPEINDF